MAVIEARGLSKRYGAKLAVDDLSFDVKPGSVTGFLGPNGAGKSTTMRLMLGLDRGRGTTLYDGRPFENIKYPMREVGALLEAKPFHPTRKARNHLKMLAVSNDIPLSRVAETMDLVGLSDVAKGKPKNFSMGMGQRLGLAAAAPPAPASPVPRTPPASAMPTESVRTTVSTVKSSVSQSEDQKSPSFTTFT